MEWKKIILTGAGFTGILMGASYLVYHYAMVLAPYVPSVPFSVMGLISGTVVYGAVIEGTSLLVKQVEKL